jgi:2-amino-4-hydroxy-6-hydroxymethyldihydropteridine diphosphokinase
LGPVTVYLGLGSNLGQREANLAQAVRLLVNSGQVKLLRSSSIYEAEPWGFTDQPSFLNAVLEIATILSPVALLELVKIVEAEVGREPTFRWGPRLIDVDILLYGDQVVQRDEPDLQIPHPRLGERAFVLVPLAELAPELVNPLLKVRVDQLAAGVEGKEGVKLWGPPIEVPDKLNT